MSEALINEETKSLKISLNAAEGSERINSIKKVLPKENNISIKNILDLNSNKSINDLTRSKISKMELDIEVIYINHKY